MVSTSQLSSRTQWGWCLQTNLVPQWRHGIRWIERLQAVKTEKKNRIYDNYVCVGLHLHLLKTSILVLLRTHLWGWYLPTKLLCVVGDYKGKKVNFQPVNTGGCPSPSRNELGQTYFPDLFSVVWGSIHLLHNDLLPSQHSRTHLYTWVKGSNYG